MENTQQYLKYLPNGAPSALSLNYFVVSTVVSEGKTHGYRKKRGKDFYSLERLREETEKAFGDYDGERDGDVIGFLNRKREEGAGACARAYRVVELAAEGLAQLFFTLRTGAPESRRKNHLTDADWAFWKNCSYVFFVGRLAEGALGQRLEAHMMQCLTEWGASDISVRCASYRQVRTPSLLGCARAYGDAREGVYVFDFGNTAFKRGRAVSGPDGYDVDELSAVIHRDYGVMEDTPATAEQIHRDMMDVILQTIKSYGEDQETYEISLCIANNIIEDRLMDRGYYRSLRFLSPCYGNYLQQKLAEETGKRVSLKMWNDAGAVAGLFSEWAPRAAVVTLGTYMGIAYPEIKKI